MRARIIVSFSFLVVLLGVGAYVSHAGDIAGSRQWAIVNFMEPVQVKGQIVMGAVLIVHDSEKMARGEACTTFYRFEPGKGPKEELLSFHCSPQAREAVQETVLTYADTPIGCKRLVSYQIAGDSEAHGVPAK